MKSNSNLDFRNIRVCGINDYNKDIIKVLEEGLERISHEFLLLKDEKYNDIGYYFLKLAKDLKHIK